MPVIDLFNFDKQFNKKIIGTDEAGRGPAAGGVYAAAVCFDGKVTDGLIKDLEVLNDSKKLTPKKRESIYDVILNNTLNKIVCIEVEEIERINEIQDEKRRKKNEEILIQKNYMKEQNEKVKLRTCYNHKCHGQCFICKGKVDGLMRQLYCHKRCWNLNNCFV